MKTEPKMTIATQHSILSKILEQIKESLIDTFENLSKIKNFYERCNKTKLPSELLEMALAAPKELIKVYRSIEEYPKYLDKSVDCENDVKCLVSDITDMVDSISRCHEDKSYSSKFMIN